MAVAADRWENAEDLDFHLRSAQGDDGIVWIWLQCSVCGNVRATAQGEASDLGDFGVAAQGHYERRHLSHGAS